MKESLKHACVGVDAAQDSIAENAKNGSWGVIAVMGVDEPSFAYTVGLHHKGLPELIIVGLAPESAMAILNQCAERMVSQGGAYPAGTTLDGLANLPLAVLDVSESCKSQYTHQAYNHYRHWDFGVQQLVMPDAGGKFPWYGSFDSRMHQVQPLLGDVPPQEVVTVTVHATCHDSGETVEFTRTVSKFVVEDHFDCQDFVKSLLPAAEGKWTFWEAYLLNEKGENIGWTNSEI